jgi:hypothetical protein
VSRRAAALLGAAALAIVLSARPARAQLEAPLRLDEGRFTVVAFPDDETLARAMLRSAAARDSFPGLPRSRDRILIAVAPDDRRFREWIGPHAPEWGAAVAFPDQRRIVMQGGGAGSTAGEPLQVLRHEIAHLALAERLGDLPPRWFDEGYASVAAGEWGRDEAMRTVLALVLRGVPPLDSLDAYFHAGAGRAEEGYALAHRAVEELAALDPSRGLSLFFEYWRETGSLDQAVRRAYGITLADFEKRWQQRTRRRYGGLALVTDLSLGGVLLGVVLLPIYLARRRRDRRRMALLVAADRAAERAERDGALAAILGEDGPASGAPGRGADAPSGAPAAGAGPSGGGAGT